MTRPKEMPGLSNPTKVYKEGIKETYNPHL